MLAALRCEKGEVADNLVSHRGVLAEARDADCQLVAFPEMSLSGSVDPVTAPGDLLPLDSAAVQAMVSATAELSVGAVFGVAERGGDGQAYIAQVYACQGEVHGVYRKRHLGAGEEAYTAGTGGGLFSFGALCFGIALCAESGVDYPFDEPASQGADLIFFCAAPGLYGRRTDDDSWRAGLAWWEDTGLGEVRRHAARTGTFVAVATQAGSTVDEDFPGLAALVAPDGRVVSRLPDWLPGTLAVELPVRYEVEPPREAARVLVVDGEGRALLVRFSDSAGHSWWAAPGGGLEAGEDHVTAARRELAEELARGDLDIGPEIGRRSHTFTFDGGPWMTQRERWFLARCEPFDVPAEHVASLSSEGVAEVAWWTAAELESSGVPTAPRRLAELLRDVVSGPLPEPGTDLGP